MIDEWDITATNQYRMRQRHYEVAVLSVGAIEPHGLHLPVGMDFRHTTHVVRASCAAAWERCESVLCLPTLPFGVDCNLRGFPMAIHVSQQVVDAMLREVIASCRHYGIRKFVLINGHGGNDFLPLTRQIQCDMDVHVFMIDWWKVALDKYDEIFTTRDDHAGQFETSLALALFPEHVELDHATDGATRPFRFEAMRAGWVSTSRDFAKLTDNCDSTNPAGASAERAEKYLELVIARIADFLVELAAAEIDEYFPFRPGPPGK